MRWLRALTLRHLPALALGGLRLSHAELGWAGECLAARWLRRQGARVLARRWCTAGVEVDLFARDHRGWILVEVKTGRVGRRFRPADRLDAARRARLRWAARRLARGGLRPMRVDLVEVRLDPRGRPLAVLRCASFGAEEHA